MRLAGAIPFLLAVGALPAPADTLPAYCGAVGAKSYTPPTVTIPPVVLDRGTVITVTNATVVVNGDTSSVPALAANPGPDGISLQEAVMAANNSPGTWNIQFAPALKGSSIVVDTPPSRGLAALSGGNVTINGDIDGDGQPDITLTSLAGMNAPFNPAITVWSGGITLYGLALQNFTVGVFIGSRQPAVTGMTFSNITISKLVLTNIQNTGILLCPECGPASLSAAGNVWDHLLITGNTITGAVSGPPLGIMFQTDSVPGDTLQHAIVANNNIVLPMPGATAIAMNIGGALGARNNQALDTLIANNAISSDSPGPAIRASAGGAAGSSNLIDGLRIIANQVQVTGHVPSSQPQPSGIGVASGDAASDDLFPSLRPIQYSENNIARNIGILSNTIEGAVGFGVAADAACCGNSNNTIDNLSILGNTMTGSVQLTGGATGGYLSRPSAGNSLSNVLVQANSILNTTPTPNPNFTLDAAIQNAGIGVWAGSGGTGNSVNALSIANNDVNTPFIAISIVAGYGNPGLALSLPTVNTCRDCRADLLQPGGPASYPWSHALLAHQGH